MKGLSCPECGEFESLVLETRQAATAKRRRRECVACNHRYSTYEVGADFLENVQVLMQVHDRIQNEIAATTKNLARLTSDVVDFSDLADLLKLDASISKTQPNKNLRRK